MGLPFRAQSRRYITRLTESNNANVEILLLQRKRRTAEAALFTRDRVTPINV